VEVTLTKAAAFFPAVASMWVMRPMPQATIEEFGEDWVIPGNLVSNGPYVLTEWSQGAMLRFKKNPYYYDAAKVQIEVINGPVIMETSTAMSLYEAGELDSMSDPGWGVPLPDIDRVKADPVLSKEFSIEPNLCTYYYGFVTTKPPFDNVLVRKAFAAAIDRKALIENVTKGGQLPAHTFACPGIWGAPVDDMTIAPYLLNIEEGKAKAQEFLAEAGYPNCEGFPEVTLMHNVSEGHALIAQAIQEMWRENLGCTVKIETMEWSAYLNMLLPDSPDADKPDIYRLGWCADYPDEANWVGDVFHSQSSQNYAKFFNDEFDALVEEALGEQDLEKRADMYNQAEHLLIDENMAIAPIYYYTRVNMFKPYLIEHPINPAGGTVHVQRWVLDWEAKKAARGW
jgi:oligopeptide transport system substrate-binding protein